MDSDPSHSMDTRDVSLFLLGCPLELSQSSDRSYVDVFSRSIENTSVSLDSWSESVSRSSLSRSISQPRGELARGTLQVTGAVEATSVAPSGADAQWVPESTAAASASPLSFNPSQGPTEFSVPPPSRVQPHSMGNEPKSKGKGKVQPPLETMAPGGGGNFTLKNHIKKSRPSIKSKNRKTTRKNGKFKSMIKKHNTKYKKYKTYKRKANGRKLIGNKHRNNKTMRRYRCVRK
jgi:hypothetical protein